METPLPSSQMEERKNPKTPMWKMHQPLQHNRQEWALAPEKGMILEQKEEPLENTK